MGSGIGVALSRDSRIDSGLMSQPTVFRPIHAFHKHRSRPDKWIEQ